MLVTLFGSIKSSRILGYPLSKKAQIYNRGTSWAVLIWAGKERDHPDCWETNNKCFVSKINGKKMDQKMSRNGSGATDDISLVKADQKHDLQSQCNQERF